MAVETDLFQERDERRDIGYSLNQYSTFFTVLVKLPEKLQEKAEHAPFSF